VLVDALLAQRRLNRGPKMHRGDWWRHLLATLRSGLKRYSVNITAIAIAIAIVTVADDGGSSGVLRCELACSDPATSAIAWTPYPVKNRC
jgi:hypothetical protein